MKTILSCSLLLVLSVKICACTTFCLSGKGERLYGANYDFDIGDGLIFVNKRGVQKVSTTEDDGNRVRWTSRLGNVTFNQFGRENPIGGMNEKGLVVQIMWLEDTTYPKADKRPTLDVLEWVQYQLDTSSSIADVLASSKEVRVTSDIKLHYLVSDQEGNAATIEYIGGQLVTHSSRQLPIPALTNDVYDKAVIYARTADQKKATTDGSLDRFFRVAMRLAAFRRRPRTETDAIQYAFKILSDTSEQGYSSSTSKTWWSIVYDQSRKKIFFRTLNNSAIRSIKVDAFDFSCHSAVKYFDVDTMATGDVTKDFVDYTQKANRDLIERTFTRTSFLKFIPKFYRDLAASYPEQFLCTSNQ